MITSNAFNPARRHLARWVSAAAFTGLAALSLPALAQTFTNSQLAGTYTITKGVNNDGSAYDGKVRLTPDASGGVTVRWDDNSVGVGMIEGNRLFIGMTYERRSVVMAMTFAPDGRTATGRWILRTEAGVGIEEWRKD